MAGCCASSAANAATTLEKGYLGVEAFYYPNDGAPGQNHGSGALISQLEWQSSFGDGWSSRLTPFARADAVDPHRSIFDLREAELDYANGPWRYALGMRRVSWSVTESVNVVPHQVVDIINQRDLADDPAGQEKLGAAMAMASYQGERALVQAYVLPWFRPRRFPDTKQREHPFRGAVDLNDDVQYVSGAERWRPGVAVRFEQSFDSANLALIQYRGYAPQPLIAPDFATGKSTQLYYLVDMSAFTVQATLGQWLLKSETAYFSTRLNPDRFSTVPANYWATVSGVEYTFVRAVGDADLGLIAEGMYDSRGNVPNGTQFQKDIFMGVRWTFNDQADSQILGGVVSDLDQRATISQVQFQRRFGKHWDAQLTARAFNAEAANALHALSDDTLVLFKLRYFF